MCLFKPSRLALEWNGLRGSLPLITPPPSIMCQGGPFLGDSFSHLPKGPANRRLTFWDVYQKWEPKKGKPKGQKVDSLSTTEFFSAGAQITLINWGGVLHQGPVEAAYFPRLFSRQKNQLPASRSPFKHPGRPHKTAGGSPKKQKEKTCPSWVAVD